MQMRSKDKSKVKRFLYLVVLPIVALVLVWSYQSSGQLFKAAQHAMVVAAFLLGFSRLYQLRLEKKNSGLTEDEYILKQAGGATALLSQSITTRAIGWLCIAVLIIIILIAFLATKSLQLTVVIALLPGIICVPSAIGLFRVAARGRRIAEAAGAKIW